MESDTYKKRLRSGDYIDYSVEYFRQNFKTFLIMTSVFHVPFTFILFFLLDYGNLMNNLLMFSEQDEVNFLPILAMYLGIIFYSFYNSTVVHSISLGSIKHTYENIVNGNNLSVKESLKHGFKRLLWYVLYLFLFSMVSSFFVYVIYFVMAINILALSFNFKYLVIIFTVVVSLVVSALLIYFLLRIYFVPHAISIEKVDCFKALKVSWQITSGKVRHILWPIVFGLIFSGTFPQLVQSLAQFSPFDDPLFNRFIAAFLMALSSVIYPFIYILTTQLYIYLKNQKGLIDFNKELNNLVKNESSKITFGQVES